MSRPLRVWLLQSPENSRPSVLVSFLRSLGATNYFDHISSYIGKDNGWSNNIMSILGGAPDVFFMGCEDHICIDLDTPLVELAYIMVNNGRYDYVRLTMKPQIKTKTIFGNVPAIDESYKYYISLQPSIWSKKALESILIPDETAWDFEVNGSKRAKAIGLKAGVTYMTAFNYKNLIEKGHLVEDPKDYRSIHG